MSEDLGLLRSARGKSSLALSSGQRFELDALEAFFFVVKTSWVSEIGGKHTHGYLYIVEHMEVS